MLPSHIPFRESSIDPSPVPGRKTKKRPEIWIVLSVSQVLRLVDLQPCIESIDMLTSDELRHADKSQRWHRNHSGDERVADAPRLSSPIPRKSHLRRAGWDYGGVDGQDRAARRQSGTLPRVTVGAVGRQDFPRIRPPSGVSVFPPVIVRRLRRLRAALVRTVHCSSHAHRPVSLVPPTISGRIPVFLRYINIYISIIAGSRDACFAGTRHCARVASRCATPHQVTL